MKYRINSPRPNSSGHDHSRLISALEKNLANIWVRTVPLWADASKREVSYALCNDRRTLLWFANQRAVEYHIPLIRADRWDHPTHLVLDLDPPSVDGFGLAVRAAHLVCQTLTVAGLVGAVKTSGAKGVHVFVPIRCFGGDRGRGCGLQPARPAGRAGVVPRGLG